MPSETGRGVSVEASSGGLKSTAGDRIENRGNGEAGKIKEIEPLPQGLYGKKTYRLSVESLHNGLNHRYFRIAMCITVRAAYKIDIGPAEAVKAGRGGNVRAVMRDLDPVSYRIDC